uniref:Armadillo repeat-containing protein 1 n=1 Tax=Spongospora subterranea TaxID=70186 RepID=A0A0H5RKG1_9EUKA|eukprot:CRZ09219.1 hypothetical protein [Spongospora subterranea]
MSTTYSSTPAHDATPLHPEAIALKLRQLATEPDNQLYIAREQGCIGGLINFLSAGNDLSVMLLAAQTVLFLSSHPSNRTLLLSMKQLVSNLTELCTHSNQNLAHFCSASLVNLAKSDETRVQSFKKKSLESVKLQLNCASDDEEAVKSAILQVAGVVSVSINRRHIATVYSVKKSLSYHLVESLRRINIESEEILEKFSNAEASGGSSAPQYLEHQSFKARPDALSIYADSFEESSLANRLARQRQLERKKIESQNRAKSIFSKVWTSIW